MTETHVELRSSVRVTPTEYGAVLLDLKAGTYWELNEVAFETLQLLIRGWNPRQVALDICEEFDVSVERAATDVEKLISSLTQAGLIDVV